MKPPKTKTSQTRSDVRFSVAFSKAIMESMSRQMVAKGFNNNISAFLADCVRRQEERDIELEALRRVAGGSATGDQVVLTAAKHIVNRAAKTTGKTPKSNLDILIAHEDKPMREIIGFRAGVEQCKLA